MEQHLLQEPSSTETKTPPVVTDVQQADMALETVSNEIVLSEPEKRLLEQCRQVQRYLRRGRICHWVMWGCLIFMNGLAQLNLWLYQFWKFQLTEPGDYTIMWLSASMFLPMLTMLIGYKQAHKSMDALKEANDLRAVGALTLALQQGKFRLGVERVLTRLLPRLQATDALLLNDQQRGILYQALKRNTRRNGLRHKNNADFAVAILKAFEQVGDSQVLPYVEDLANSPSRWLPLRVKEAARGCLPFLRQRIEQQRASQTLLRASDLPTASPDSLLRPALGTADTQPQTLLRPTVGTNEGTEA